MSQSGKLRTYQQHMRAMKEEAEKSSKKNKDKPWICEVCKNSGFKLSICDGQWIRTCKKCSKQIIID